MAPIARAAGQPTLSFYDSICIQSFVLFTANLIPLPGASGGAELAFTMYFGSFFKIGAISKSSRQSLCGDSLHTTEQS